MELWGRNLPITICVQVQLSRCCGQTFATTFFSSCLSRHDDHCSHDESLPTHTRLEPSFNGKRRWTFGIMSLLGPSSMSWFQYPPPRQKKQTRTTVRSKITLPFSHSKSRERIFKPNMGKDMKTIKYFYFIVLSTSYLVLSTCQVAGVQHCHAIATIVGWMIQPGFPQKDLSEWSLRSLHLVFLKNLCVFTHFFEKTIIQLSSHVGVFTWTIHSILLCFARFISPLCVSNRSFKRISLFFSDISLLQLPAALELCTKQRLRLECWGG